MRDNVLAGPAKVDVLSRADAARAEVRRAIILGALKPGARLAEEPLSVQLGVSRPTVREALNSLAEEGLVEKQPYKGMRVSRLTVEELRDIADARLGLDMLAIDFVLKDETGQKLEIIEKAWDVYKSTVESPDLVYRHDAHLEFHRQIWMASGNLMLLKIWPVMAAQMTIALAEDSRVRHDPLREYRVHKQLLEAIRTKDRERIKQEFMKHTVGSSEELIKILNQK